MADRSFQKKKRNDVRRQRKPVIVIAAEGRNKTEYAYFASFREQHGKYVIRLANTGLDTDPKGMLNCMDSYWKKNELSTKDGDKAYIVLDMDLDEKKINTVKRLQKKTENVRFIASNPCIEVWFILHFIYTTHPFKDSKEPKKELAKYIDGYKESMDIAEVLRPNLEDAKKRIEQLKAYYKQIGTEWGSAKCNPMSDVVEIIEELEK